MYTAVTPSGTVGGSVIRTAKVPVPLGLCVLALEVLELLVLIKVLEVELLFTIPGVNTTAPISATAIIAARTPDTITLFFVDMVCRSLDPIIPVICIRNSALERLVQPLSRLFKLLNRKFRSEGTIG